MKIALEMHHPRNYSSDSYQSINKIHLIDFPQSITIQEPFLQTEEYLPQIDKIDFMNILKNLIPNIFNQFMHFVVNIIFTHYLGNSKNLTLLTGVTFGLIYNNIFLYFLAFGVIQGIAVFCPNAFSQRDFILLGTQINQVRLLVFALFGLFMVLTFTSGRYILIALAGNEVDDYFISVAYDYILYTMIGNFFEIQFEIYCKYCETQLFYSPIVQSLIVSIAVNILSCYLFIDLFSFGVLGASLAFNLTNVVKFLFIFIVLLKNNPYPQSNFFINSTCFNYVSFIEVAKVCFYSMIISYFEFIGFSFSNLFSVNLSESSYAKYIVISNIYLFTYPIGLGVNNTVTIITSYFYALKDKENIMKSLYYVLFISSIIILPFWIVFIVFWRQLSQFFCNNDSIYLSNDLYWSLILNFLIQLFDNFQNAYQGVLRGFEILKIVSYSMFVLFLIVLPGGTYFFAFVLDMNLIGIFIAENVSYSLQFVILAYWLYYQVDIDELCKVVKRSFSELEEVHIITQHD